MQYWNRPYKIRVQKMSKTMKTSILLFLLWSCSDPIESSLGCRTAADKSTGQRVFLRCETREQFNPTKIRASQWDTTDSLYTDYRFEDCEQCK